MRLARRLAGLLLFGLVACSTERPVPEMPSKPHPVTAQPENADFFSERLAFSEIAVWSDVDLKPSVQAFQRSCDLLQSRPADTPLSSRAGYGGVTGDWLDACTVLPRYRQAGELRRFFEDYFDPYEIVTNEETNKLTGYFEPVYEARRRAAGEFTAPVPGRPADLIEVDLGRFDPALQGRKIWGKAGSGELDLYPARRDISASTAPALAYAHPMDVFFLQIQGSGRLVFPDGEVIRAAFDSHNHRPFGSLANHLIKNGEIERSQASMAGLRQWLNRVGTERAAEAMAVNPRFVFFRSEPILDPQEGPKGAQGLPLEPEGSVAVDLSHHPMGVPFLISSKRPGDEVAWKGEDHTWLLISQDTGGAIQGIRRGDIYFGTGPDAGRLAGSMNYEGRFIVLLPQTLRTDEAYDGP